jgi:hypothetical protein
LYLASNDFKCASMGERGDFNYMCHCFIYNNFDGSNTIAMVIEFFMFNFSHSLSYSSIGELLKSCSSSWTNCCSHATCYQQLELLLIFLMVFFTSKLINLNGELGDNFWCSSRLASAKVFDNFIMFDLNIFIIS